MSEKDLQIREKIHKKFYNCDIVKPQLEHIHTLIHSHTSFRGGVAHLELAMGGGTLSRARLEARKREREWQALHSMLYDKLQSGDGELCCKNVPSHFPRDHPAWRSARWSAGEVRFLTPLSSAPGQVLSPCIVAPVCR
jgi:hypothetical protein